LKLKPLCCTLAHSTRRIPRNQKKKNSKDKEKPPQKKRRRGRKDPPKDGTKKKKQKKEKKNNRLQSPTELWKKKRFNLQAPPVCDRKVTNLFFRNYFFHNYYFFHNSVGDCITIDSQFECILRGNIEL